MGEVTELQLSLYLVLLSIDSKIHMNYYKSNYICLTSIKSEVTFESLRGVVEEIQFHLWIDRWKHRQAEKKYDQYKFNNPWPLPKMASSLQTTFSHAFFI